MNRQRFHLGRAQARIALLLAMAALPLGCASAERHDLRPVEIHHAWGPSTYTLRAADPSTPAYQH